MLACVRLGGMTMAEADKVRKIIGKKKDAREFDQFKELYIGNASGPLGGAAADKMWHDFEAHAGYSFNKSHAVAYSTLSYWTAWLKKHYPLDFMVSLLKNEKDKDARTEYLIECKRMGISLRLPHINDSDIDFKIEGKSIRFGLTSIKFISEKVASRYIEGKPFKSYQEVYDFTFKKGSGVNSRSLSALDAIGAVNFPDHKTDEETVRSNLYEYLNLPEFNAQIPQHFYAFLDNAEDFDEDGTFIIMGVVKKLKRGKGWTLTEILDKTGTIGVFDDEDSSIESGKTYIFLITKNRIMEYVEIDKVDSSKSTLIKFLNYKQLPYGEDELFVLSFKPRITKAGKRMAQMLVVDSAREMTRVMVFPDSFAMAYTRLEEGKAAKLELGKTKDGEIILREVLT
jgi:DNA polymerase-3 subunit alpha